MRIPAEPLAYQGFGKRQLRILASLDTPAKVQKFVGTLKYNWEENGETAMSPKRVLNERKGHCLEGAFLAAAALRYHGIPPLVVDLKAVRDDDHVICVFKENGHWGSISHSLFTGLRSRDPVYLTLRELVMSYFNDYYNFAGEKTLRMYSVPMDLRQYDHEDWLTSDKELWFAEDALDALPHYQLIRPEHERHLRRVSGPLFEAGLVGADPSKVKQFIKR